MHGSFLMIIRVASRERETTTGEKEMIGRDIRARIGRLSDGNRGTFIGFHCHGYVLETDME
jgi:hypothetical protein